VIPVVAGLLTALIWATATLTSARASRIVGPWSTSVAVGVAAITLLRV
jgi:hypothetical protein